MAPLAGGGVSYLGPGPLGRRPVLLETRAQGHGRSHLGPGEGPQSSGQVALSCSPRRPEGRSPALSCCPPDTLQHRHIPALGPLHRLLLWTFLILPGWLHSRSTQPPPQGSKASTATHLRIAPALSSSGTTSSGLRKGCAPGLLASLLTGAQVGVPPHRLQAGSCFCTCDAGITHLPQSEAYICPVGAEKWGC